MHPRMGEMMWFMRINAWHHSLAIARGPHPSLHHASFEMRGIDEYMRGTGRLLRAGVEKIWGPGRHMAGNNTFSYFLDPHGNTVEYTTELEQLDEDTWHPHLYDFTDPEVSRPVGHREPDERVRRASSRSTTPTRACSSPRRSDAVRHLGGRRRASRPASSHDAGLHALPAGTHGARPRRARGCPAALEAGAAALDGPAGPAGRASGCCRRWQPPTVRDFVAFEEHVEGVVAGVDGGAGVVPEWYEAPTFYFTNPYALVGAHDDVAVPPGSQLLDFELEVAVVVGRDGASLTPEQRPRARLRLHDPQRLVGPRPAAPGDEGQPRPGQGQGLRHHARPVAGHRRRARALPGRRRLPARWTCGSSVNGAEIGQDLLSNMGWPFEELIAYASRGTEVRAGDVLGSGTCGNGGCLAELWGRRGELDPAAAAARRRRRDDRRGHRHHPQPRRRRASTCRRSRPARPRPRNRKRVQ